MPERHDGSYRLLFSYPRMVEDLLRGFLPVEVPEGSSLERRAEIQVSDRLHRREQDLVWCLRGPGREPILNLMLEFQSEVDPDMDLRISIYKGLLSQDLRRSQKTRDLPPVEAAVLYNGRPRWNQRAPSSFRLIDLRRHPLPADPDNLVALLCQLERSKTPEALTQPVERLARLLAGPEMASLRRAFVTFLRESLLPGRFPETRISAIIELEEVRPMLRETVMKWTREWERRGQELGRREGEVRLLLRQLAT